MIRLCRRRKPVVLEPELVAAIHAAEEVQTSVRALAADLEWIEEVRSR